MRVLLLIPALAILGYCKDETVTGHGGADVIWRLAAIDNVPFTADASLWFPEEGVIAGAAPCNRFTARQAAPYPWFHAEAITVGDAACPQLEAEAQFLGTLADMTLVEVIGPVMILSTETGREMVFQAGK